MKFYRVGGINRDMFLSEFRGINFRNNDIDGAIDLTDDFSTQIRAEDMFQVMRAQLISQGFEEFEVHDENFVVRAKVPKGHPFLQFSNVADFNMCRREGPYSDGRHPDWNKPGDIFDDLARRDFTGNAIAISEDGSILDPHDGINDLRMGILRFVGDPEQRIREDGLRVLRALRFMITRDLFPSKETREALRSDFAAECLFRDSIADERIQQELNKMVRWDSLNSILLLAQYPALLPAIFKGKVRLDCPEFIDGEKQDPDNVTLTATMRKK